MISNKDPTKRKGGNRLLAQTIQSILDDPVNDQLIRNDLSDGEWEDLNWVRQWLLFGYTGKPRPPPKQHARLGAFVFLSLHLPNYELYGPVPEFRDETIVKYRQALPDLIKGVYGEDGLYQCGFKFNHHKQGRHPRQPTDHWHLLLGRLRFAHADLQRLDEFNALPKSEKPRYSQFFLVHGLRGPGWEIAERIEKGWRRLLSSISRIRIPKDHPALVHDSDKDGQTVKDSKDAGEYANNNGLHTFRSRRPRLYKDGVVLMDYLNSAKEVISTRKKSVLDFVRDDLLKPNHRILTVRYPSYGFLTRSRFTPVIEAAKQLKVVVDGQEKRLLDLPVEEIHERAAAFRRENQYWPF